MTCKRLTDVFLSFFFFSEYKLSRIVCFLSFTCSYAGGGNYKLEKQDCERFCDFIGGRERGEGKREREPSVINCERMTVYLYCAFLRPHSDLTARIIEVHCLTEVGSFLVATSPCANHLKPSVYCQI